MAAVLGAGLGASITFLRVGSDTDKVTYYEYNQDLALQQNVTIILKTMTERLDKLQSQVDRLSKTDQRSAEGAQIAALTKQLSDLQDSERQLDRVILASPAKALEIPIIRRDIDAIRQEQSSDRDSTKREIDRSYDLFKWIIGSFAVSILALVASNFLKR